MTKVTSTLWVEIELEIEGTYIPHVPERGPSYCSGGEPAEPAHIEDAKILSIWTEVHGTKEPVKYQIKPTENILQRLEAIFSEEVEEELCSAAENDE